MIRRSRIVLWFTLAGFSVLAWLSLPVLLRFEKTEATVTRGHFHEAIVFEEPLDIEYTAEGVRYEVRNLKAPPYMDMTWTIFDRAPLPISYNHWFPRWWRWDGAPQGIPSAVMPFLDSRLSFSCWACVT